MLNALWQISNLQGNGYPSRFYLIQLIFFAAFCRKLNAYFFLGIILIMHIYSQYIHNIFK